LSCAAPTAHSSTKRLISWMLINSSKYCMAVSAVDSHDWADQVEERERHVPSIVLGHGVCNWQTELLLVLYSFVKCPVYFANAVLYLNVCLSYLYWNSLCDLNIIMGVYMKVMICGYFGGRMCTFPHF
jgi:hypothetical protein